MFRAVHPERIARAEGVKRQITQSKEHCAAEQPRCVVIFSLPIDVCVYDVLFIDTSKKKGTVLTCACDSGGALY